LRKAGALKLTQDAQTVTVSGEGFAWSRRDKSVVKGGAKEQRN
jgi:hypothetical protein